MPTQMCKQQNLINLKLIDLVYLTVNTILEKNIFPMNVLIFVELTITRFGFHARWIDSVECGLFSNHAPLGQTTLCTG